MRLRAFAIGGAIGAVVGTCLALLFGGWGVFLLVLLVLTFGALVGIIDGGGA